MVEEFNGIILTKDNLKFPVHFNRVSKDLRNTVEVTPDRIIQKVKEGINYFRLNKKENYWSTSFGDLFLIIFRCIEDEEYSIVVSKDFYETNVPFEKEDYE